MQQMLLIPKLEIFKPLYFIVMVENSTLKSNLKFRKKAGQIKASMYHILRKSLTVR